jgi:hypothetical protein
MDLVSLTVFLEEAFPNWSDDIDAEQFAEVQTVRDVDDFVDQINRGAG